MKFLFILCRWKLWKAMLQNAFQANEQVFASNLPETAKVNFCLIFSLHVFLHARSHQNQPKTNHQKPKNFHHLDLAPHARPSLANFGQWVIVRLFSPPLHQRSTLLLRRRGRWSFYAFPMLNRCPPSVILLFELEKQFARGQKPIRCIRARVLNNGTFPHSHTRKIFW